MSWPCAADTRFTVKDVGDALLEQLKTTKEPGIVVKQPEEDYIRFNNYGRRFNSALRNKRTFIHAC